MLIGSEDAGYSDLDNLEVFVILNAGLNAGSVLETDRNGACVLASEPTRPSIRVVGLRPPSPKPGSLFPDITEGRTLPRHCMQLRHQVEHRT